MLTAGSQRKGGDEDLVERRHTTQEVGVLGEAGANCVPSPGRER